jgi:hypothetical protein
MLARQAGTSHPRKRDEGNGYGGLFTSLISGRFNNYCVRTTFAKRVKVSDDSWTTVLHPRRAIQRPYAVDVRLSRSGLCVGGKC